MHIAHLTHSSGVPAVRPRRRRVELEDSRWGGGGGGGGNWSLGVQAPTVNCWGVQDPSNPPPERRPRVSGARRRVQRALLVTTVLHYTTGTLMKAA